MKMGKTITVVNDTALPLTDQAKQPTGNYQQSSSRMSKQTHRRSTKIVSEGEAVAIFRDATAANSIEFDSKPFAQLWPLTVGIDSVSNLIDFVPPGTGLKLAALASDDRLFLFPEF